MDNVVSYPVNRARSNGSVEFQELIELIIERRHQPEDRYEIAAILESMGWNDTRANLAFGVEDVFELAEELWEAIRQRVVYTPFTLPDRLVGLKLALDIFKSFLRGLIFALPMAISVFAMLTLRFSLWSYEKLSIEFATCIAVGTILSFLTVGGFTQAIARRGFFYLFQNYYNMARRITFFFIRYGIVACVIISVLLYFVNLVFNIYPQKMFMIIVLYYFFLSCIWLSVTVMYMLRKELVFTALIVAGIGLVYLMFVILNIPIVLSQLIAVTLVSITGMGLALYYFRKAEQREERGIAPQMTRLSIMIYAIMPYFIYGLLYFAFLYTDRVISWSTDHPWDFDQQYMPYFIWFRGPYELGLDFALLVLMIPLGISEVIVNNLMRDLEISQKSFLGFDYAKMNRLYRAAYVKMLAVSTATAIISAIIVYNAVLYFNVKYLVYAGKPLLPNDTAWFVFVISLIAYAILSIGLMNAVIMFSFSQPGFVNRALAPAFAANVLIGFLLTRWVDYSWGVYGLLIGSVLFTVLTTLSMIKMLGRLDYYLYSAS
ncbi:hypothetical protein M5X11_04475 [Paenibacillus alginolyticus]|uniref:Uncharacterized protein n=1 Tax=Paenibacillus alginolyticus TaxID=59839 RepID=A0ABT4GFU3_9BACL|nr:hypothetical protein [Paenibacillus alginolyticus]MCY9664233.1 hypothetical protein [Paenibacillus alginolyticus]MCY9695060.1 hypothetical protein [Paenibacillus alginolyticus]MEC0145472.1 hypothetical protein [Paenibacillus alginolyticus]